MSSRLRGSSLTWRRPRFPAASNLARWCASSAKIRYTYYHSTGYRGNCELPYFREEELGDRLGSVLRDIHIPDDVLSQLEKSLLSDKSRDEAIRKQQAERLRQRLSAVRHRLDQAYLDKLDGKISEEFWTRKSAKIARCSEGFRTRE